MQQNPVKLTTGLPTPLRANQVVDNVEVEVVVSAHSLEEVAGTGLVVTVLKRGI